MRWSSAIVNTAWCVTAMRSHFGCCCRESPTFAFPSALSPSVSICLCLCLCLPLSACCHFSFSVSYIALQQSTPTPLHVTQVSNIGKNVTPHRTCRITTQDGQKVTRQWQRFDCTVLLQPKTADTGNIRTHAAIICTVRLKFHLARLDSTRLDTFDVSSPCILAVSS